MMKHVLSLLLFITTIFGLNGQTVYEDFEGGASKITWNAVNGLTYEGPIANPGKDAVNSSDFVGKFTNDGLSDFCFALGDLATVADLSTNNLVKVKIWSPVAPIRALVKMEGGGKAIEKFIDITTANAWVEYSVDFSAAKSFTTLNKVLLAFNPFTTPAAGTFYFDDMIATDAKQIYETFETGNEMGWKAFDGTLEAPIANPAPNKVNSTPNVGKYTKSGAHSYSLLLAERSTPFDLSVLNQFKLHIHASAPTQVLLKLEGVGPAAEKIVNIGLANEWQEYTFDMSFAKDYKQLTKAILFFDPGVETSADIYHFDNFYAVSQGECAGVAIDTDILDDFECQRNGTYVNGWDSVTVITNPAPDAVNGSTKVGKYVDHQFQPWNGILFDYQNPIDLNTKNQWKAKIWSAKQTRVLVKLEGGASAANEVWIDINDVNQWVQYEVDFSSQALASHKKLIMFFNAGNDPAPGDVYFVDDFSWGVKTETDIENFENGAVLPWEPLDQQTLLHGAFAVINNPDASGVNTSAKVGKYTKGVSQFSTLAAVAPGAIDISSKPQFNLDVWAPVGSKTVIMQLESATGGNKEVERDLQTPGAWETLSFDFSDFQSITDWEGLKLIFNPGVAEEGAMFFFDNLKQGDSTVDPCEGSLTIGNIIDDFECQRNYEYGAGAEFVTAVNNPKLTAANSSTKVGLYKDQAGQPWSALCANFPDGIPLDVFNQLELQVLSTTAAVPLLLKLEGGTSPAKEIWSEIKTANEWYSVSADFSGEKGNDHKRVCFFFNGGVETTTVDNYYIDNVKWSHAPYDGCLVNYDDPAFVSDKWRYFPADNSGGFEVVDNPLKAGINTSNKVGKAIEKASGEQPWQGMYTDLESYIKFGANTIIKAKILSPKVGAVTLKVEKPLKEGFPGGSGDNTVTNTKANEWEELTWDFSASPTPIDPAGNYARLTFIFDINNLPTEDVIYYFDDIRLEKGDCGQESSASDVKLETLSISPNPVNDVLKVNQADNIKYTDIVNIYGQQIARVWNNNQQTQYIDVSSLPSGTFVLMGYGNQQHLVAQARFVKM